MNRSSKIVAKYLQEFNEKLLGQYCASSTRDHTIKRLPATDANSTLLRAVRFHVYISNVEYDSEIWRLLSFLFVTLRDRMFN